MLSSAVPDHTAKFGEDGVQQLVSQLGKRVVDVAQGLANKKPRQGS